MQRKHYKYGLKMFGIGLFVGLAFIAGLSFNDLNNDDKPVDVMEGGRLQYRWHATPLPSSISFAGEKVPLQDWEVKERLDRELLINYYTHGSTLYLLKHTTRVFPTIEKILKEQGIPDDFKYLCAAESALRNQISSAGAVGYWQFLKATGIEHGMEITDEVDERYDLEKSTLAACKYLRTAYARFGSWTAAAASYNCGMGGYNSRSSFQGSNNYYDLLLPEETNRYIYRILALKQLIDHPEQYGFILPKQERYEPISSKKVKVTSTIDNLATFAREHGSTYKKVKIANPWLRSNKLTVKNGKIYEIAVPIN